MISDVFFTLATCASWSYEGATGNDLKKHKIDKQKRRLNIYFLARYYVPNNRVLFIITCKNNHKNGLNQLLIFICTLQPSSFNGLYKLDIFAHNIAIKRY